MSLICIDPGHQKNPDYELESISPDGQRKKAKVEAGTIGICSRKPEYEVNLEISLLLQEMFKKSEVEVVLTRTINEVNISNKERALLANNSNVDLCIKIHCNGIRSWLKYIFLWRKGIEVLVPAKNYWTQDIFDQSLISGKLIHQELLDSSGRHDRGLFLRDDMTGFNWSKVPVVLVEVGYLTNLKEDTLLNTDSFKQKIAMGIYKGVLLYLGGIKK
jgi:N-acetylmuramoyl-L-alanine amidase